MSFRIVLHGNFEREARPLLKRYRSLAVELTTLRDALKIEPHQGQPIGMDCYKIRLAIRSKGRGKSGGARVITCVVAVREEVYLLSIYDKSEQATLTDKRLKELLKQVPR
jgi:mRNA-degrading endonuclease RelE of RelBE toxin-antitoxin system